MSDKHWRVHPAATRELHRAARRYDKERPGLAADFLDAYELAYARARRGPVTGTAIQVNATSIRRMLLDRFPFALVIAELEAENVILAVAHVRRAPLYWQRRLATKPEPANDA
jgi:hypothetical protein